MVWRHDWNLPERSESNPSLFPWAAELPVRNRRQPLNPLTVPYKPPKTPKYLHKTAWKLQGSSSWTQTANDGLATVTVSSGTCRQPQPIRTEPSTGGWGVTACHTYTHPRARARTCTNAHSELWLLSTVGHRQTTKRSISRVSEADLTYPTLATWFVVFLSCQLVLSLC